MIEDRYKYRSVEVAKAILAVINEGRYGINMTKLQKLLYIVYGFYLARTGCRLTDEHAHAWPYGPVFPKVGKMLNAENLDTYTFDDVSEEIKADNTLQDIFESVVKVLGIYTAGRLTAWSHKTGSPWDVTKNIDGFAWNDIISDELIADYFKKYISDDKD